MFSRPDPQSFTKFAISAGVFLLIAAVVVPALVLRETGVLRISVHELATLTPLARKELERRQGIARSAGVAAPYVGLLFLLVGGALLVYGVPRLKRKEHADEDRFSVELTKLRSEIEPQSEGEREERLKQEVEDELNDEVKAVADADDFEKSLPAEPAQPTTGFAERMQRLAMVEGAIFDRLARIAPPNYELQAHVKVAGGLLLDGLLVSRRAQLPDIVVEIRLVRASFRNNFANRLDESAGRLLRYRAGVKRSATGWLIFVFDGALSAADRDYADIRAKDYASALRVSVVTTDELPILSLPEDDPRSLGAV